MSRIPGRNFKLALATGMAIALIAPAGALAAAAPGATTGAAASVGQQTVTLTGSVDPNQRATTYFFRYGTTTAYGAVTPTTAAGSGDAAKAVAAAVGGLAPLTTYHYRLVAHNALGTTRGADRTFRTKRQPLGVSLAATPNPVPFGAPTVLFGTLTGTGNTGRQVVLQGNPFPYTTGFANVSNVQVTNTQGGFSFPLLSVALNTQYRVVMPQNTNIVSPIVSVGVGVLVSTSISTSKVRRGGRIRFSGTIRPARDGAQIAFQKLSRGRWVTIGGTITRHGGKSFSRYSRRVKINRGGSYRVFAGIVDGNYVSATGRVRHIHTHR
jgi:hypothetical protein